MYNFILKKALPLPKILDFQSFLFVGPHPDDIEVSCAPTVRYLTERGKKVTFLVATDGEVGALDKSLFGEPLVAVRRAEANASADLLGVNSVTFLPFHDGGMYPVEEMALAIAKKIVRIKPDVVFVCDPTVRAECHLDHVKVGQAVCYSMTMCPFPKTMGAEIFENVRAIAFYNTDKPNTFVPVKKYFPLREEALKLHKSQFDEGGIKTVVLYNTLRSVHYMLRAHAVRSDAYRVLSPAHMHCFPEASNW